MIRFTSSYQEQFTIFVLKYTYLKLIHMYISRNLSNGWCEFFSVDIMNRKSRLAWELYLKMETSGESFSLLQLIANDCYKVSNRQKITHFNGYMYIELTNNHWCVITCTVSSVDGTVLLCCQSLWCVGEIGPEPWILGGKARGLCWCFPDDHCWAWTKVTPNPPLYPVCLFVLQCV